MKARHGKTERIAFNRLAPNNGKYPCPQKREEAIKEALLCNEARPMSTLVQGATRPSLKWGGL